MSVANDHGQGGGAGGAAQSAAPANPYYVTAAPDLDAGAARLDPGEMRRLNRRALAFLAGIVLLLVAGAGWLFRVASADSAPARAPREQDIAIPALPKSVPEARDAGAAQAASPPIPMLPAVPPELPPIPDFTSHANMDAATAPSAPLEPSLLARRRGADAASLQAPRDPFVDAMLAGTPAAPGAANDARDATVVASPATGARAILAPGARLLRGTMLRCVLETRIVTDIPGFTSCVITEPVHAMDGSRRLLPRGSRAFGRYDREPTGPRVAVVWDRIVTPEGIDVAMASPGVDTLGGAGHPGDYSAHWGSRIGSAVLVSLVSDAFRYVAAEEGPQSAAIGEGGVVVQNPYESTTARTVERLAQQALDTRRPPTVTIDQGTVVSILVARDVDFSAVLP